MVIMKSTIGFLVLIPFACAFPSTLLTHALRSINTTGPQDSPDPLAGILGFDATKQYVSNTGAHAFVAPRASDKRGPCPGLNAMANHGYLPHNGIATMAQFIEGTYEVFGMGVDLATVLAVYGAVFDGDLLSYSIGGPAPGLLGLPVHLLGTPQGLSGSHNNYEGDVSPTRGDLYQYGNAYKLQLKQFTELYKLGMAADNYDLELLTNYRVTRFKQSVAENPYFFNAPFSGVIASPAAWSFIYRFMANKSEEYPAGQLNGNVLKTFYAVTGDYPNFEYHEGMERIPDNWYTRARGDEYTVPFLAIDAVVMALEHLEFLTIGGNTGTTDSFVGIDPANITSGIYNAPTLLEGNNLFCYAFQLVLQITPDFLSGLLTDVDAGVDQIGATLNNVTNSLGCAKLNSATKGQFEQALRAYPGANGTV